MKRSLLVGGVIGASVVNLSWFATTDRSIHQKEPKPRTLYVISNGAWSDGSKPDRNLNDTFSPISTCKLSNARIETNMTGLGAFFVADSDITREQLDCLVREVAALDLEWRSREEDCTRSDRVVLDGPAKTCLRNQN